jgi:hypothetical protein
MSAVEALADLRLGQRQPLEPPARPEPSDRRLVEAQARGDPIRLGLHRPSRPAAAPRRGAANLPGEPFGVALAPPPLVVLAGQQAERVRVVVVHGLLLLDRSCRSLCCDRATEVVPRL